MNYEDLKKWIEANSEKIILAVCFVLIFMVGFGAGRFSQGIYKPGANKQLYNNYTTNSKQKPGGAAQGGLNAEAGNMAQAAVEGISTTTAVNGKCPVKGNISAKGKKVYHIPGGAFYVKVKPEQCFNTEAEAAAAGFVKSGR